MNPFKENPLSFFISNENLIAVNNDDTIVIDEDHVNRNVFSELMKNKSREKEGKIIKNVYESQKIVFNILRVAPSEYYLKIDYQEKQTSLPWCVWYASANIFRFMVNPYIYANTIAQFGNISTSQAVPTSVVRNNMSYSKPIMGYYKSTTNTSNAHALVIHGISTGSTITVRNPWYQYSETYNGDTGQYTATNGSKWSNYAYVTFVK